MDASHIITIIGAVSGTIGIYEAVGRGVRTAGRKVSAYIKAEVQELLPEIAKGTLNGRYPLTADVNPRFERIEESVATLPQRLIESLRQECRAGGAGSDCPLNGPHPFPPNVVSIRR